MSFMNKIRVNSLIIHFKADPLSRRFLTRTMSSSVTYRMHIVHTRAHRFPKKKVVNIHPLS